MLIPRKTWFLLTGNALMFLFCGWAYSFKVLEFPPPAFPVAASEGVSQLSDTPLGKIQKNNATPQRSLFFLPQQKDSSKPVAQADDGLEALRKLTISGIIIDTPNRIAIIQIDGRPRRFQEGEKFGDWVVKAITRKEVIFARNDRRFSVPLDKLTNAVPRMIP